MITKAKVSSASVKAFEQAAVEARDFSTKFDKGISCIEQFLKLLEELEKNTTCKINEMQTAKKKLAAKILSIEGIVARLTARINELHDNMARLESKLSSMTSSFTTTDENGKEHEYPNPAYVALEAEIAAIQSEIEVVEVELFPHEQRLDRAHHIDSQLSFQIDYAESTLYSLTEKIRICKQLISELQEIKNANSKKCVYAVENLRKIEKIIASYMRIKMTYDQGTGSTDKININININKTSVVNGTDKAQRTFSEEEIAEHQIVFDSDNHIIKYEDRKFVALYSSYKDRIGRTSKESPILGKYEGVRGESKYIPSNRNAEGIVVIGILKKYGLDGIEYRNSEPDFEVCADTVVKISHMSEYRYDFEAPKGMQGNFTQADIECAKVWNFEEREGKRDWTPRKVLEYRQANGFTWHEKCDTETMVMVKSEINAYFKHSGGCSECRLRDATGNEGGFDE